MIQAPHEDDIIRNGVRSHGFKWTLIARQLPGRTDNAVRNRWKRLEEGESWRQQMVGEGVDVHQMPPDQVPGYKCRKCGKPKRGHTCPFNAPPVHGVATSSRASTPPRAAEHTPSGLSMQDDSLSALEPSPSGRIDIAHLHALLAAEGPGPGPPSAPPPEEVRGAQAAAPRPPAELTRSTSSIERLLAISRDFSRSFLKSINGWASAGPAPSEADDGASGPSTLQSHVDVPPRPMEGDADARAAADDAWAIAEELRMLGRASPPPPLQRNNSSLERWLARPRELSRSFIADVLGLAPPKPPAADGVDVRE